MKLAVLVSLRWPGPDCGGNLRFRRIFSAERLAIQLLARFAASETALETVIRRFSGVLLPSGALFSLRIVDFSAAGPVLYAVDCDNRRFK